MKTTSLPSTMSVSDARTNLYDLMDEVSKKLRSFVITHKGQPTAVVMPVDEVEAWEETLEILSDKRLMRDIRKGQADIKAGRTIELHEFMSKMGIDENKLDK